MILRWGSVALSIRSFTSIVGLASEISPRATPKTMRSSGKM
jgi:hypothetical protein